MTALAGEVPGCGGCSDQAILAALRYSPQSEWHKACGLLLDQLPKRQAAALLMQAARILPEKMSHSIWMVTARQRVKRQEVLLRAVGLNEAVRHCESVEAFQLAGKRKRLWQTLAVGEVGQA
ncbi:hypothetical protein [Vreelandella titanicae]|uniref:hypothetical protein n=1 Tax=Vreelandella titanicae TaxID=664683 RepID=UPI00168122F2|nr:hypothetical protein [Halomonas titanicae]QNU61383.1 hypothetical protein HZS52_16625 [Halomonas titanicae]